MPTPRLTDPEFAVLTGGRILTPRAYYVSVAERTPVFSGTIFDIVITDFQTLGEIGFVFNIAGATGSLSDVRDGMSIDFGTTPGGRDIGTARVRGSQVEPVIYINEIAPASLPLADGIYFTIVDEYIPHLVLPLGRESAVGTSYINTITMFVDYDKIYTDQNENFTPKANITRSATLKLAPRPSDFVDGFHSASPLTYRTITLSGLLSFCIGSSIVGYLWEVIDGTITVGTSTSATITVQFPVGFRHVRLTVTAANGKTSSRVFALWVHDADHMPLTRFMPNSNNSKDWRELELEFSQQDTSELVIPKGTTLCFWEDDPFWGVTPPDAYRDQVIGWAKETVTLFRKYRSHTTLTITGLGEWLDRDRAIPQRVYDPITRAAQSWFEMADMTLDKLAFIVFENFSTANKIANLFLSGVTDLLPSLDITGQSHYDMIRFIMNGNYSVVRCKSLNDLQLEKNYQYMTATERSAVDTTMDLTSAHWPDENPPKITQRGYLLVASVLGAGGSFDGTTNVIVNARAPGRTPGDSNSEQDAPGQNLPVASAQDVLQQLTGAYFRLLNNERDSVPFEALYNIDALEVGDLLSLTTTDSDSGLVLDHDLFMVKEVAVTFADRYSGRGKKINYTLEGVIKATTKDDAQFVEVEEDETDPVDSTPPEDISIPPPVAVPVPPYDGTDVAPTKMIIFDIGGANCHVATSWIPASSTVNWVDCSTGLTGTNIWSTADSWNYDRYFALQSTGLYKNENPFGGGTWVLVATNAQMFGDSGRTGKFIAMSINRKGYIGIVCGTHYIFSYDYGSNWHDVDVLGGAGVYQSGLGETSCLAISPYNSESEGWIYFSIASNRDPSGDPSLYKSLNWGESWTAISRFAYLGDVHIPYIKIDGTTPNKNTTSQELYTARHIANESRIYISQTAGTSWGINTYAINAGGNYWTPPDDGRSITGWWIQTFTYHGLKAAFGASNNFSNTEFWTMISDYGGDRSQPYQEDHWGASYGQHNHINGYPIHSHAHLRWSLELITVAWTLDDLTWVIANIPSGYAGASYVEWNPPH